LTTAEIFPHVRVLLGTVIGLGIARLLLKVANVIQHPTRAKTSLLHMLWVGSLLIELVLFWWWELSLFQVQNWTFCVTLFLITYAVLLFLIASLLTPDSIEEYEGYEEFFLQRRKWFFGLFALVAVFDVIDTVIKVPQYLEQF